MRCERRGGGASRVIVAAPREARLWIGCSLGLFPRRGRPPQRPRCGSRIASQTHGGAANISDNKKENKKIIKYF